MLRAIDFLICDIGLISMSSAGAVREEVVKVIPATASVVPAGLAEAVGP
jgi:hypothetical protein